MSTTTPFDQQLRKGFQDLQVKVVETRQRLRAGEVTKERLRGEKRIAELTKTQLSNLPLDNPVYKSIGRIFVLDSIHTSLLEQDRVVATAMDKTEAIDKQAAYLEKNLAEAESGLRELIQSRR